MQASTSQVSTDNQKLYTERCAKLLKLWKPCRDLKIIYTLVRFFNRSFARAKYVPGRSGDKLRDITVGRRTCVNAARLAIIQN